MHTFDVLNVSAVSMTLKLAFKFILTVCSGTYAKIGGGYDATFLYNRHYPSAANFTQRRGEKTCLQTVTDRTPDDVWTYQSNCRTAPQNEASYSWRPAGFSWLNRRPRIANSTSYTRRRPGHPLSLPRSSSNKSSRR